MRHKLTTLLLSLVLILPLPVSLANAASTPRSAPNIYVDWTLNGSCDVLSVDWYCEVAGANTYWAVHNWDAGYAGFQVVDGKHVLLMSLWDLEDGTRPRIEYSLDGRNGDFDGEGTGKQVFTNYNWEVGKWYTMRIQVYTENDRSYYEQWICEEGGPWCKTAVVSYPVPGRTFANDAMFQEDFTFNNVLRTCRLRNAYGRRSGTGKWDPLNNFQISNNYFPTDPPTWDNVLWNIDYNCDWGMEDGYVRLSTGGGDFTSIGKAPPVTYRLDQPAEPAYPIWLTDEASVGPWDRSSTWAADYIQRADAARLIPDCLAGLDLHQGITRHEFAAVAVNLCRALGGNVPAYTGENPFTDTKNEAVLQAYGLGIVKGMSSNTFAPHQLLTREQAVAMLGRVYELVETGRIGDGSALEAPVSSFSDLGSIAAYAKPYINFFVDHHIVDGMPGGQFAPRGTMTREQAIKVAIETAEMKTP